MNPDRSRARLLAHAEVLAKRVIVGQINDSAVRALIESVADLLCTPECKSSQLAEAIGFYEGFIDGARSGEHS